MGLVCKFNIVTIHERIVHNMVLFSFVKLVEDLYKSQLHETLPLVSLLHRMRVQNQFSKLHEIILRCGVPGIEVIIPYHCLTCTVCKSTYLVGGDSTACDTSTYVYAIK